MADKIHVFISYATKDATFVNILRRDLAAQGIVYWIDKEGLRPGTINWEKGIRQALRDAFAVIYVVTPASYASDNVQGEIAVAEVEGCIIYPIWADGDRWHDCVPIDKVKTQYIDMRGDKYELNRQVLFNALGGKRPDLVMSAPTAVTLPAGVEPRNPYKGLNAFTERDVADFFGRDKLITELLQAVNARIQDRKDLFLTVIGASGSGKSSVVMAGLLPRLKAGKDILCSDQWTYLKPMVPGDHPVQALAKVLYSAPGRSLSNKVIDEDLSHPNGIGLLTTAETLPKHPVVLYIDQFEELFMTGVLEEERHQFINLLINAVTQPDSPVLVLLTMRADFYDRPMNYPELGRLVQSYNRSVLPMSIADLRDTVEKPAAAAGLTFDSGLIADIIFDLRDDKNAQAGALPLLQYTLEQLYERRTGNTLTAAAYQEIGGVKGAIGAHAEEVFNTLDSEAQNAFARVFQALVHVDEKGTPTRKRETEALLTSQPASARLVEALVKRARVLRVYTEKLGETPYIEVAHEALLTSWQRLSEWIKSADNDLRNIQEMKASAARWVSEGKPKHRLWSHELLHPVYQALDRFPQDLADDEKDFIRPEVERLFEEFKRSPEHVQLTIAQLNLRRIGREAVTVLIQAFGYSLSKHVEDEIISILWEFPMNVKTSLQEVISTPDPNITVAVARLIAHFEIYEFVSGLLNIVDSSDVKVRRETIKALGRIGNIDILLTLLQSLNDKEPEVRDAAAEALSQIGDIRVKTVFLEFMETDNWELKMASLVALGTIEPNQLISRLLEVFTLDPEAVCKAAEDTFGKLRNLTNEEILPALIAALKANERPVQNAAAVALRNLGDKRAATELIDILTNDINSIPKIEAVGYGYGGWEDFDFIEERRTMWIIAEALGNIGEASAVPVLIDALHVESEKLRQVAVEALGKIRSVNSTAALSMVLEKDVSKLKTLAVEALGNIGDESALPALLKALNNEYEGVREDVALREAAAEALGKIGDKSLLPLLIKNFNNFDGEMQRITIVVLGKIGDKSLLPLLIKALKINDRRIRQVTVDALGKIGDTSIVPLLTETLKVDTLEVRVTAAKALGEIGGQNAVSGLLRGLKDNANEVRVAAADALGKVGDASVIAALVELLKDNANEVRVAAADALGKVGDASVVAALVELLKDNANEVRVAAADALGKVGDTSIITTLFDVIKTDEESVCIAAVRALGNFGTVSDLIKLITSVEHNKVTVRQITVETLGKLKNPQSTVLLKEMLNHPFGVVAKPARQALELMDIPESRAALAEWDAKHKG